jgi:hypothetical protein
MKLIEEFTSTTTFQIEEVTSAFIELKRKGITATTKELNGIGKVAAANNVSIKSVAEGITRAATTSIEQLQMLGFTGKSSGDMITLGYGEGADRVEETFKKTSKNVMDFVAMIGDTRFDSAIRDRANTVTGAFSNMSDNVGFFAKAIGQGGLKPVLVEFARGMSGALIAAKPFAQIIGFTLKLAFDALKIVVRSVKNGMAALKIAMGTTGVKNFALAISGVVTALIAYRIVMAGVAAVQFGFNMLVKRNPIFLAGSAIAVAIGLVSEKLEGFGGAMEDLGAKALEVTGLAELTTKFKEMFAATVEETKAMTAMNEALQKIEDEAASTTTAIHDMTQSIAESSSAFTTDFITGLMEGKSALASFGSFAKDIVKQIISTFLRMTVVNKILNHVFSGLSGYTPMGTAKPSDFPNPFSKAGGGTVQAGRPTLVGERGAEIFVPNSSGRIMNNADSQGAGGGGGVVINQNINFSTGVVGQVRSELAKLMPQISDTTKAAVLEASQRGGSFRKGLMGA